LTLNYTSILVKDTITDKTIPEMNINARIGIYLKISRLTPVLDVNVVEPVKFRARKATTGVMINILINVSRTSTQPTIPPIK
jgi:hypothetical protein